VTGRKIIWKPQKTDINRNRKNNLIPIGSTSYIKEKSPAGYFDGQPVKEFQPEIRREFSFFIEPY
jgi:hypothetical protein